MRARWLLALIVVTAIFAASPSAASARTCGQVNIAGERFYFATKLLPCGKAIRWTRHIYRTPRHHSWEPPFFDCKRYPLHRGGGYCRSQVNADRAFYWYRQGIE